MAEYAAESLEFRIAGQPVVLCADPYIVDAPALPAFSQGPLGDIAYGVRGSFDIVRTPAFDKMWALLRQEARRQRGRLPRKLKKALRKAGWQTSGRIAWLPVGVSW